MDGKNHGCIITSFSYNKSKTEPLLCIFVHVNTAGLTVLDEDLRACEASMNGCHVQGALPFFAL